MCNSPLGHKITSLTSGFADSIDLVVTYVQVSGVGVQVPKGYAAGRALGGQYDHIEKALRGFGCGPPSATRSDAKGLTQWSRSSPP